MKIAVTGGSGRIGQVVVDLAVRRGDAVVSIDRQPPPEGADHHRVRYVEADVTHYESVLRAVEGCDALIHLAAIPSPLHLPDHVVHNTNVVGSYNALRAAIEQGIRRISQASSVNAVGLSFSRAPRFDYFPIDEQHPNYGEDPYSLSKWICEQQADSLARRYEQVRIASLRFHLVVSERAQAAARYNAPNQEKHLWAYTLFDSAARACLLSLDAAFEGHEAFYIVAPDTTNDLPTVELARRYFPDVPIRGDLGGHRSFFSTAKAERLLGWSHDQP
jgi:nucleoside-diphosphate-sugar epimerase